MQRRITRSIWRWERSEYGLGQGRAPATVKGRGRRCAGDLLCAVRQDRLLGYADVMPLSAARYQSLRLGRIVEERLPAHWTARGRQTRGAYWYIASLIVSRNLRQSRPLFAHALSDALQRSIWSHVAARGRFPVRVLGISATSAGQAKFRQTGFRPVARVADAVDLRPRFERVIQRRSQLRGRARRMAGRAVNLEGASGP